ncbi:hypothetical protein D3C87_1377240 [compost metagenome]
MQHGHAGLVAEQLAGQMQAAADAGAGVAERRFRLIRLPGQRDQLRHGARLDRRVHRQHVGRAGQQRDGPEIARDVVGQCGEQRGVDGQVAGRHHQPGAAIARRAAHGVDADIAVGAGLVVDDHRRALALGRLRQLLEALRQRAGELVSRAAGRERHHDPHRVTGRGGLRHARHRHHPPHRHDRHHRQHCRRPAHPPCFPHASPVPSVISPSAGASARRHSLATLSCKVGR